MKTTFKDCVKEWPPRNTVASEHSPEIDDHDVIRHARVSSSGSLILSLIKAGQEFTASTLIHESSVATVQELIACLPGKTMAQAGDIFSAGKG
jgi:hypothetical protein